jgi:C4-dicarboxylate-specific signal transduction histidine kinase
VLAGIVGANGGDPDEFRPLWLAAEEERVRGDGRHRVTRRLADLEDLIREQQKRIDRLEKAVHALRGTDQCST